MNEFFKDIKTIERMNEGPMGRYIARYATQLHVEGYARQSGRLMLEIVAGFVQWLKMNHVRANRIKSDHAKKYLRFRKRRGYRPNRSDHAALARWLKQLQEEGAIAEPVSQQKITPAERVLEDYDKYAAEGQPKPAYNKAGAASGRHSPEIGISTMPLAA